MVQKHTVSLRNLGENRAREVAFGRFLRNSRVTISEILGRFAKRLGRHCQGQHILAIQDTTEVNYQAHVDRVEGLGTVGNGKDVGFFLHPVIAVESDSKALLGLCNAIVWQRFKHKAPNYQHLPIVEKESNRWLEGAQAAKTALSHAACVTIIADRESDIYEEWVRIPDEKTHLLTRACRDRSLEDGTRLFALTDSLPVQGIYSLNIPARKGKAARTAVLGIRFGVVVIKRPQKSPAKELSATCSLQIVDVREITPPSQEEAIHWRLLTTHEVETTDKALEIVEWYCQRWQVEQVFRTLKRQGLNVESSQMETAEGLEKLVVLALLAAIRCLQLVSARDGKNKRAAQEVFDAEEIHLLEKLQPRLEGKTEKQKNPHPPKSLAWSTWLIARLGGWKGYASERLPGPITIHNGLKSFSAMLDGWLLAKLVCIH